MAWGTTGCSGVGPRVTQDYVNVYVGASVFRFCLLHAIQLTVRWRAGNWARKKKTPSGNTGHRVTIGVSWNFFLRCRVRVRVWVDSLSLSLLLT